MDVRRLYKSDTDKMICGVCGGIGEIPECGSNAGAAFMGDPDLHRAGGSLPISSQRSSFRPKARFNKPTNERMCPPYE